MFFVVANVSTGQAGPPRGMELHTQIHAFLYTCVCVLGGGGGGGGGGKETSSSDSWFRLSPLNVVLCACGGGACGGGGGRVFPRDNFHCMTGISAAILL